MMDWILETWDGKEYTLPLPTSWRLEYALGTPCDAFFVRCPWETGQEALLADLCRLRVVRGTETVFTGLVDECECQWSDEGILLEINGRGLQALLLDNEALGADFGVATLEEILRRYVTPHGVTLAEGGRLPPVTGFSVASGSSCWQVLYQFARYHGGVTPRFDRRGGLLLSEFSQEPSRVLDSKTPLQGLVLRHKRYGVLSQIQMVNRVTKAAQTLRNESFQKRGGFGGRVLTVPRKTGFQAMRYNGQFQLKKSEQELYRVELTVAEPFLAYAGELIQVGPIGWPLEGLWRVVESRTTMDETGCSTRLVLAQPDVLL